LGNADRPTGAMMEKSSGLLRTPRWLRAFAKIRREIVSETSVCGKAGVSRSSGTVVFKRVDSASPEPDAVRRDVGGAEIEVLRGARHALVAWKAWTLCEVRSSEGDRYSRSIMSELGYRIETAPAFQFFAGRHLRKDV
jgi:hypothetical protein